MSVFPEHNWMEWKFNRVTKGFWTNKNNQRNFMDWLGKQVGFKCMDDWYNITRKDFLEHGGMSLMESYRKSPARILQAIYPEHNWMEWKFSQVSRGYWDDSKNLKQFLEWLGKELNIKRREDWYRVSIQQIRKIARMSVFNRKNLLQILKLAYPEYQWNLEKKGPIKAQQRVLIRMIEEIFPNEGKYCMFY